ncbi:zf-TFIIB domain-containing protein [Glycomyces sp. L485]|uniref:TFIIB-type zinc ribbon-containing protein n=1 Tax=Glycomyces sp. L485 TaxID=2909235 RepID=UPI001F4A9BFF|nr:zf-TFIIB domain-containing protein [Glycomyces sp. L485]MCH7229618.1 zf-TFIIB domain-containing protein [Glycomyces sp. L485]
MDLTCPKCGAMMRQYERNRVTVDQCTECRGIFLDRGELDHLLDAEAAFNAPRGAPVAPAPQQYRDDRRYDDHRGRDDYHYKKKKKRSLFAELFDD